MTPRQKDEDWDNRKAFPDCEGWYERCRERSLAFSRSVDFQMDRAYGPNPRNRIDVLPGKPDLPTLFHIHGGYWQWNNREDYLCVGEAVHRIGLNTAFVEHTLAPDATMNEIVAEVKAGLSWFRLHCHEFGIENSDVVVSGHSSGGHLAAMCQGESGVVGTLLISGVYDLRPITQIYVNDVVRMDEEMAKRNSPALRSKRYESFAIVAYGELELKTFREQSNDYHQDLVAEATDALLLPIGSRGHFDVLDELMNGDGVIFKALMDKLKLK